MVKRKNAFTERKQQRMLDEFTGLRLPRGVKFEELPPAIVDDRFIAKPHDKVAYDYPVELGQKVVCVGTVMKDTTEAEVYIWNETMGNRVYSFRLPHALPWVCDIRLLTASAEEGAPKRRRRRKNDVEEVVNETSVDIEPSVVEESL